MIYAPLLKEEAGFYMKKLGFVMISIGCFLFFVERLEISLNSIDFIV